jgi:hypothetical protein
MSLDCCAHLGAKLPDNVTCGEGCDRFPACLPTLELVRKLIERSQAPAPPAELLADPLGQEPPVAAALGQVAVAEHDQRGVVALPQLLELAEDGRGLPVELVPVAPAVVDLGQAGPDQSPGWIYRRCAFCPQVLPSRPETKRDDSLSSPCVWLTCGLPLGPL